MKNLLVITILILVSACTTKEDQSYKTVDWYKSHPDVLKADLEKCESISIKNQENWCAAAQQANRNLAAQRIRDGLKVSAFPD